MKRRRSFFTLLELTVALFLIGLLFSVLFGFVSNLKMTEKKVDRAREAVLQRQKVQVRLHQVFSQIVPQDLDKDSHFYVQFEPKKNRQSLFFCFDNGIDPDPNFSGFLGGLISLDERHNLTLTLFPMKVDNPPCREEVLCKNIDSFHFSFLDTKKPSEKNKGEIHPYLTFTEKWPKKKRSFPNMIRLELVFEEKGEKNHLTFAFFLPILDPMISYADKNVM